MRTACGSEFQTFEESQCISFDMRKKEVNYKNLKESRVALASVAGLFNLS